MTDTPDEEECDEDGPGDDPPSSEVPSTAANSSPRQEDDGARDVIGTALGALRAMSDSSRHDDGEGSSE